MVELKWSASIIEVWMDYWRVFMAAYFQEIYDRDAPLLDPGVRRLIEQGRGITAGALQTPGDRAHQVLGQSAKRFERIRCLDLSDNRSARTVCHPD